ncbi:MAG TPA: hypothetical protein VFF06_16000 [Polyangia bacterium]|nr:hypothetical protein [Polyangia bacterium]
MMRIALAALLASACTTVGPIPPGADWSPPTTPDWAHQARFAITDNRSDWLSVVTPQATPALLANVPVGDVPVELEGPHHLAASPDGSWLVYNLSNYVPGTGSGPHGSHGTGAVPGSLVKLDAHTMAKLGEVLVDRSPGDVVLSKDGKLAYVTHYDLLRVQQVVATESPPKIEDTYSALAIVNTDTMERLSLTPICATAHGEGLSHDGKTLYATCQTFDEIVVVDVSDPTAPVVKKHVSVGATPNTSPSNNGNYGPYALTVAPTPDERVWISSQYSADVRVFDPATMAMDSSKIVQFPGPALFGDFTLDGKTFFVPHQGDDQITAVDTATLATTLIAVPSSACMNAHMVKLTPDGKNAIMVCEGDHVMKPGTAVMMSIVPPVVTGFVPVGIFPDGAAWLPPAP